jgi:hypothetical protein
MAPRARIALLIQADFSTSLSFSQMMRGRLKALFSFLTFSAARSMARFALRTNSGSAFVRVLLRFVDFMIQEVPQADLDPASQNWPVP